MIEVRFDNSGDQEKIHTADGRVLPVTPEHHWEGVHC